MTKRIPLTKTHPGHRKPAARAAHPAIANHPLALPTLSLRTTGSRCPRRHGGPSGHRKSPARAAHAVIANHRLARCPRRHGGPSGHRKSPARAAHAVIENHRLARCPRRHCEPPAWAVWQSTLPPRASDAPHKRKTAASEDTAVLNSQGRSAVTGRLAISYGDDGQSRSGRSGRRQAAPSKRAQGSGSGQALRMNPTRRSARSCQTA